jgi:LmbE family N-acetylglucosaminyl deacetylase
MRALRPEGPIRSVVALGAHPDDLEIGVGGLLLSLAQGEPGVRVHYVLCSGTPERHAEARAAAAAFLPGARLSFALHALPDGRLPARWAEAKQAIHEAAAVLSPDLVLAPRRDDAHQDHRLVAEVATQAFRDQLVLHYEIPKWDGDLGRPNVYLPLPEDLARRKVELLNAGFPSQKHHDWWDDDVFLGLMRVRGMECRARYAEAFDCTKAVVALGP